MTFTNFINNFYKNEKDLGLQKFPRHISMNNIYYLLIKCNTFEEIIKLISKFPLLQRWELNLEIKINFNIDYNKTDDKIDIVT